MRDLKLTPLIFCIQHKLKNNAKSPHRVLHALRTQRRRVKHEDTAASRRTPHTPPRPESSAEEREVIEVVEDAIASLPTPQRDVVTLRLHHDMPYQEIAMTLSVPVGTVRSRLGRARQALLPLLMTHLAEGCPICEELRDAVLVA